MAGRAEIASTPAAGADWPRALPAPACRRAAACVFARWS